MVSHLVLQPLDCSSMIYALAIAAALLSTSSGFTLSRTGLRSPGRYRPSYSVQGLPYLAMTVLLNYSFFHSVSPPLICSSSSDGGD